MISVIIPTYSRSYLLKKALDTIVNQNFQKDKFEIVVVDNNSSDDTREVTLLFIKQHPLHDIKYVFEGIPGLISSRHRGVKEAKYEILSFVDEDVEADSNWLLAISESFNDVNVMIATGKVLPKYETEPPYWLDWFWTTNDKEKHCGWLSLIDMGEATVEIDPTMVWGVNYSIRKKALLELGGFHPDSIADKYFCFGGDGETGLSLKAKERGYKAIYKPEALIYHFVPTSRMTHDYFRKRAKIQGKCNSFTQIRKLGKVPLPSNPLIEYYRNIRHFLGKVRRTIFKTSAIEETCLTEEQFLRKDFQKSYLEGYEIHQKAVKNNPELLNWVLKDNYWDYSLPKIKKLRI